jgi:hypothetical protein
MLKIGTVKWRGKCPKHPDYNPMLDGVEAIQRNCPRCLQLAEIFDLHQRTLRLMRTFQPVPERPRAASRQINLQQSLFS